jgi:hypothetical protein
MGRSCIGWPDGRLSTSSIPAIDADDRDRARLDSPNRASRRYHQSASSLRASATVPPAFGRRIGDPSPCPDHGKGSQRGGLTLFSGKDVDHGNSVREYVIGDDSTVTTPPDGFGAHDRARFARRHLEQLSQAFTERGGLGVVGVVMEAPSFPTSVRAFFNLFALGAPSTERREVDISKPRSLKRGGQHIEVELRMGPRARGTSDVDETGHLECAENVDELARRPRRMSKCVKCATACTRLNESGGLNGPFGQRTRRRSRMPSSLGR